MSYKIQITVDEQLNETVKARATMSVLPRKNNKLLKQAIEDVRSNNLKTLTLAEFNRQIDHL